jgi:hypothetical protein
VDVVTEVTAVTGKLLEKAEKSTHWYSPEIGLIKIRVASRGDQLLKSFTPGTGQTK